MHVNGQATAVALYKSALQFQKMSPETRKANSMGTDTCQAPFLGPESFVKFCVLLRFNLD